MTLLKLQDFDFDVPTDLVAQEPPQKREQSRLLVRTQSGEIKDHLFSDLISILPKDCLLVMNNTQVFPSRLFGTTETGKTNVEVFLLEQPKNGHAEAFIRRGKKLKVGDLLKFSANLEAKVIEKIAKENERLPRYLLSFNLSGHELSQWLYREAFTPLPHYIKRQAALPWNQSPDAHRYQTVYAKSEGSVAAPTAGLHFTQDLLDSFSSKGITCAFVTLHVGAGTFLPVHHEDISQHQMHTEKFIVPTKTWELIQQAKANNRKVVVVGTTTLRALESFQQKPETDVWLPTQLFLYPKTKKDKYHLTYADGIITNFHQPCSSLFMLVCFLLGYDEAFRVYKHAIDRKYRLFSYGDTSLLWL